MPRNITQEELRSFVEYDRDSGVFIWRIRDRRWHTSDRVIKTFNSNYAGKTAGTVFTNQSGKSYITIGILYSKFYAHRLAILYEDGMLPVEVDHIDGNGLCNAYANLRVVTHQENNLNTRLPITNSSGIMGVTRHVRNGKWQAQITVSGTNHYLGQFDDICEAEFARKEAEKRFGFHKNHGSRRPL
jgi:hypothetical protein